MIIFLYGPNSFRRQQKRKEYIERYKNKYQAIGYFDFNIKNSDAEFEKLREFCSSHSLFENVKLAVVENFLTDQKAIVDFLKANLENKELTILLSENKAPIKKFDFLLKKPVLAQEFKNLTSGQFEFFTKKEAEKQGVKLTADALTFLAESFNEDSWGLINELKKLSLFNDKNFNSQRLKEIVENNKPTSFNEFFSQIKNLLWARSFGQKLVNLEFLLLREDSAKIFNFLASFSNNPAELTRKFADYDIAVKSGKMDYEEALMLTIL